MPLSIFCLVTSRGRVDRIIHELKGAEFSPTAIGVLFLAQNAENDAPSTPDSRAPTNAAAQSAGPIRGGLAWVAGISRLTVSGIGSCIAAGPIIATLQPARNGTPGGAIARALIGLGVSATEAGRYEQGIKTDGHILISVHTANPNEILRARDLFATSNAQDICTTADVALLPPGPAVPGAAASVSPA